MLNLLSLWNTHCPPLYCSRPQVPTAGHCDSEVSACQQYSADPLPTWLLKESIEMLASFFATLMSQSLSSGEFPLSWKSAIVHLHLKRQGLDQAEPSNYCPVANLPFLSKLLERVVNGQLPAGHISDVELLDAQRIVGLPEGPFHKDGRLMSYVSLTTSTMKYLTARFLYIAYSTSRPRLMQLIVTFLPATGNTPMD